MENAKNISSLDELLKQYQNKKEPVLVCLSCLEGSNNYLMDQVIFKIQENDDDRITYYKLDHNSSSVIKQEIMVTENPVLLLIKKGEIRAIFSGLVGRFQLEDAIEKMKTI